MEDTQGAEILYGLIFEPTKDYIFPGVNPCSQKGATSL